MAEVEIAVALIKFEVTGEHCRSVSILVTEPCNVVDAVRPGVGEQERQRRADVRAGDASTRPAQDGRFFRFPGEGFEA